MEQLGSGFIFFPIIRLIKRLGTYNQRNSLGHEYKCCSKSECHFYKLFLLFPLLRIGLPAQIVGWLRKLLTQQIYSRIKHPTSQYNPTKRTRTPEGMYTQTNVASQLSEWCIAGIEKGQATNASSDSLIALHFGHCL